MFFPETALIHRFHGFVKKISGAYSASTATRTLWLSSLPSHEM